MLDRNPFLNLLLLTLLQTTIEFLYYDARVQGEMNKYLKDEQRAFEQRLKDEQRAFEQRLKDEQRAFEQRLKDDSRTLPPPPIQ